MAAVSHPLPEIPYLRLRAQFRSVGEARLPAFKGSMFRGAFGRALRGAVCAMGPGQACESCSLQGPCVYTRIFETFVDGNPSPFLGGLDTSPRPYVFEPLSESQELAPGDLLETDLLLFGSAADLHAYAVLALSRMAPKGFGRDRHPFALDRVSVAGPSGSWTVVLDGSDGVASRTPVPLLILAPAVDRPSPERLTLRLVTPIRIQRQRRLQDHVSFRQFAFQMLRRVLEIAHFHVPGAEVSWNFQDFLRQADDVRVARADLRWEELSRYSSRQDRKHPLGGLVGEMELEGPLGPFLPLLETAEVLHVGKGATFGLGRVEVQAH